MIELLLPAIIMVCLMLLFSVFIFDNMTKRINTKVKKYFIDKLQDYNYIVEERKEVLEALREESEELQKQINKNKKKIAAIEQIESPFTKDVETVLKKMIKFKKEGKSLVDTEEIVYNIPTPKFREEAFFKNYKEIKKNFTIDIEEIIKQFKIKHQNTETENKYYKTLINFKKKFSQNIIYECLTLSNKEQYHLLNETMTKEEKQVIQLSENFQDIKDFTILLVLEKVDEEIKKSDPNIYVYVGKKEANYSYIGENIKTFFYSNMSEGVIINYKGKMYDYSI